MKQEPPDRPQPKAYSPPELFVYGDIREVTKTQVTLVGSLDNFQQLKTVL